MKTLEEQFYDYAVVPVVVLNDKTTLPTPKRKAIYKDFLKSEKRKKIIDWDLLDRCYADEHREFHYFEREKGITLEEYLNNL